MSAPRTPSAPEPCKHGTSISSCGIKVCLDCGAPLNAKARHVADLKRLGLL